LAANKKDFIKLFSGLEDPREDEQISYSLNEILLLVVTSVLFGAESWRSIARHGDQLVTTSPFVRTDGFSNTPLGFLSLAYTAAALL
jgi:hypothetical protein